MDRIEGFGAEIVGALQRRRRRQQAEMIGAFRQQAVDEGSIDAVGREHRIGDALRRILVEVEAGGAESEIEVGNHRIEREVARDREGDVVRHRRGADAALGADHREDAADRLGVRRDEEPAHRAHHVEGSDRRDQVVADATPGQFAIKRHVVDAPDNHDAGTGVADLGEFVERGQDFVGALVGFDDDDVRRRRAAIGLDGGGGAAHLDLDMRLAQPPVFAGGLHGSRGFHRLAEGLHGHARCRRDMLLRRGVVRRGERHFVGSNGGDL